MTRKLFQERLAHCVCVCERLFKTFAQYCLFALFLLFPNHLKNVFFPKKLTSNMMHF